MSSFAWRYDLSRRTFAMLLYSKTRNNDAGSCNFGNNPLGGVGQDPQGWSLGLRHLF